MPTKIRLQRFGKKRSSFYHIVIADNRAPRDGKFIEKIGTYNPNTNPASINLEFQKALDWLQSGAQPTDTVRAILSYEGVLYKHHLDRGVLKGAFSEEDANKKYEAWKKEKLAKIESKVASLDKTKSEETKARLKAEEEVSKKREQEILAKNSALTEEVQKETVATESAEAAPAVADSIEEAVETAVPETDAKEEVTATKEAKAEEAKAEAPTEEVKTEAPAAEVEAKEEAPKEEVKAEAPATDKKEDTSEAKEDSEKPA